MIVKEPLLITCVPRSGSSLVTGCLQLCGAWLGETIPGNRNNQKGFFENRCIQKGIVKKYLRECTQADLKLQYPLPNISELQIPINWKDKVIQILKRERYPENSVWVYKDTKICFMWPIWAYAFPNAKWLFIRRNTDDIIQSCLKTGFMTRFRNSNNQKAVGAKNEKEGWQWFVKQHLDQMQEIINQGFNCQTIWPEKMIHGDFTALQNVVEWAGLKWNSDVLSFIDKKLWKSKEKYR
jgi:hypothetical protein